MVLQPPDKVPAFLIKYQNRVLCGLPQCEARNKLRPRRYRQIPGVKSLLKKSINLDVAPRVSPFLLKAKADCRFSREWSALDT